MNIAIIGAGAAGCFCAVNLRRLLPHAHIYIYERAKKPMQKLAITGGGRCNLTNSFQEVRNLQQVYPRGANLMKRLFKAFNHEQTMQWWEQEGVQLVVQDDQCVFPRSQDAMEIVTTLLRGMQGCHLLLGQKVDDITQLTSRYDAVVVTTGGMPRPATGTDRPSFLAPINLDIVQPAPSLFTFCIDSPITDLMGVVVPHAVAGLAGTKFRTEGPLLITHWGMSGPAILKLSSHAARFLAEHDYRATLIVNWLGGLNDEAVRQLLSEQLQANAARQIGNLTLTFPVSDTMSSLSRRLWLHLLSTLGIDAQRRCAEVGTKQQARLVAILTSSTYAITGKGTYKEEFVTAGGVALSEVNPATLECRKCENLYFAGEVLDVDAVTGGFNLQAAWTMGMTVAKAIFSKANENIAFS